VGVAVTSVPVVSKIFADLKILHTRFARCILGVAVLEDIVCGSHCGGDRMAGKAVPPLQSAGDVVSLMATVLSLYWGLRSSPRDQRSTKRAFHVLAQHLRWGSACGAACVLS